MRFFVKHLLQYYLFLIFVFFWFFLVVIALTVGLAAWKVSESRVVSVQSKRGWICLSITFHWSVRPCIRILSNFQFLKINLCAAPWLVTHRWKNMCISYFIRLFYPLIDGFVNFGSLLCTGGCICHVSRKNVVLIDGSLTVDAVTVLQTLKKVAPKLMPHVCGDVE